jgi:prepilin-type processing-associated H-X9-DG protein
LPNATESDQNPDSRYCCISTDNAPCLSAGSVTGGPCALAARSSHSSGVNVCMLDGSTRSVSNTIDWELWMALSTTHGDEMLKEF